MHTESIMVTSLVVSSPFKVNSFIILSKSLPLSAFLYIYYSVLRFYIDDMSDLITNLIVSYLTTLNKPTNNIKYSPMGK